MVTPPPSPTREAFADFVQGVLQDYDDLGRTEWENATLPRSLNTLAAVFVQGGFDQENATWRLFAELTVVAAGYERGAAPNKTAAQADTVDMVRPVAAWP